jgi:4-amino-4-deoxy-L-arabinose transferase-like glycosyltransferase
VSEDTIAAGRGRLLLTLLLAGGALVRLLVWVWFGWQNVTIHDDEKDYDLLARNLLHYRAYVSQRVDANRDPRPGCEPTPSSLRPPLYPAFLAGLYAVVGEQNFQAVRLVQIGLSLLTALLVYGLGLDLYDRRVGLTACGLYCFYPSWIGFSNLLYTEVLFTLLLCSSCYLVVRFFKSDSLPYLLLAGLLLGLAALTRSVVWLFPPVACAVFVLGGRTPLGRRLLAAGVFGLGFALPVAPWAVRNTRLEQTLVILDTMGGRNFMMGNYQYTPEGRAWDAVALDYQDFRKSWRFEVNETYPRSERDTEGKLDKLALKQGLKFVRENPVLTLKRDLIKFFHFWGLERELVAQMREPRYYGQIPKLVVLGMMGVIFGYYVFVLLAGIIGAVMVPPGDRQSHAFLLLLLAFVCGMHTLVFGHSRYHLPVMPLVLLYSASALVHARELWQRRATWSFRLAAGLCGVFLGGTIWVTVTYDLARFLN